MEYVIGLDGGGSNTTLKAATLEQGIVFEAQGASCNLNAATAEQVRDNLHSLLRIFLREGYEVSECRGICLGASGAGDPQVQERLKGMLREIFPACPIQVAHDALTALHGAFPDGIGIVIIAGTGSICYGQNVRRELVRTGGWGHGMGDEGSAYDIARQILQAVMRSYDGRGRETVLTQGLLDYRKISSPAQIPEMVYRCGRDKKAIAAIAFLCDIGYNKGDTICHEIVDSAAQSLRESILCTANRLSGSGEVLRCAYTGGVLDHFTDLRGRVEQRIRAHGQSVIWTGEKADAALGCVRLALQTQE